MSFDRTAEIEIGMRLAAAPGTESKISVRYPTDEEWLKRARARKIIFRRPRSGVRETVPPVPGDADVALYEAIKLNGAPAMTPVEAAKVLDKLASASVTDVRIHGMEAEVDMLVMTGPVTLKLNVPTADQVFNANRASMHVVELRYDQQQARIDPSPTAHLFNECKGSSEDYANGDIPVLHKHEAVRAVIDLLDERLGPKQDDEAF
jgi:hypothetical protein